MKPLTPDFIAHLSALPGFRADWYESLVSPPFAKSQTVALDRRRSPISRHSVGAYCSAMIDAAVATGPMPHGVVFIYDPRAIIDVPENTSAGPVLATKNCVSVWVVGECEGEAEVSFSNKVKVEDCRLVFYGHLDTPSKLIAFHDSGCDVLIKVSVPSTRTAIAIYTNDARNPTKVVCVIDSRDGETVQG